MTTSRINTGRLADFTVTPLAPLNGSGHRAAGYHGWVGGRLGDTPLVVSLGLGVDSVAVLIGLMQRNIRPDLILFSDTGSENAQTYAYLLPFSRYLQRNGFPPITAIRYQAKRFKYTAYRSVGGNIISNRTLPGIAFHKRSCSMKAKGQPLDKMVSRVFGVNTSCYRAIGFDASPKEVRRACRAQARNGQAFRGSKLRPHDEFIYPLQDWGWDRARCEKEIAAAGLPSPGKSFCSFCSAISEAEVRELTAPYLRLICLMEANATPNLHTFVGLWHSRRITDFIREEGLLPAVEIDAIWAKWSQPERAVPLDYPGLIEEVIAADCGFGSIADISPFLPEQGEVLDLAGLVGSDAACGVDERPAALPGVNGAGKPTAVIGDRRQPNGHRPGSGIAPLPAARQPRLSADKQVAIGLPG